MDKRQAIFIGLLVSGVMLQTCWDRGETVASEATAVRQQAASGQGREAAQPRPQAKEKEDPMVATVNGKQITRSEVDQELDTLLMRYRDQIPADQIDKARPALWQQALENLINQRLLLEEADREGIRADKKAVDARLNEVRRRFESPQAFERLLRSIGMSDQEFRQEVRQDMRIEAMLDKKMDRVGKVTNDEVKAFYRDHPESFRTRERVRASHILIAVAPDDPPEQRARDRQELGRLRKQILDGADFAEMAREHSDCPSKTKGGDLGYFEKGKMVRPFEEAAFALKVGEVSDIVETRFGYHLIKVTDHQDPKALPLDEVRDDLVSYLERQKRKKAIGDYLLMLRKDARIEYAEGARP